MHSAASCNALPTWQPSCISSCWPITQVANQVANQFEDLLPLAIYGCDCARGPPAASRNINVSCNAVPEWQQAAYQAAGPSTQVANELLSSCTFGCLSGCWRFLKSDASCCNLCIGASCCISRLHKRDRAASYATWRKSYLS